MCVTSTKVHKFEQAGLGKAPFTFTGHERKWFVACPGDAGKPGGTCCYCGTGIAECFWLVSADGNRFYVGCECIRKSGDAGLRKVVDAEVAAVNRTKRHEAKARKNARDLEYCLTNIGRVGELANKPHPISYYAEQGKTLADFVQWNWERRNNDLVARLLKAKLP